MATDIQFMAYAPLFAGASFGQINLVLISANAWSADQIGSKTVYSAQQRINAECAYALAIISDGIAQNKASAIGTIRLEDRGEVTVPKEAAAALRGMADHWRGRANSHLSEALQDPANTEPGANAPWWLR